MTIVVRNNKLFNKLFKKINLNSFEITDVFKYVSLNMYKIEISNWQYIYSINNDIDKSNITENDLSGFEWNVNKIWLWFSDKNFESCIILWKKIFEKYCELLSNFSSNKFIMSLSIDYWNNKNITLRFYKFRENELKIIDDDLEKYKENWLMVAYINF